MDKNLHFGYPMEEVVADLNREASMPTGLVNQKNQKNLVKKMQPRCNKVKTLGRRSYGKC